MNDLEKALTDMTDVGLDFYLESTPTKQFRSDIQQIREKAQTSTEAGVLKKMIQDCLDRT